MKDDVTGLRSLGSGSTNYNNNGPGPELLENFTNLYPQRDYTITHTFEEFTSLCPKTGQPDFASVRIEYVARERCVETKSLKLYLFAFRNEGMFMESIANKILEDLVQATMPKWMDVVVQFHPRGGIQTTAEANYVNDSE